jgi:hypothetical protein
MFRVLDIYIIQDFSLWFYYFLGVAFNFTILKYKEIARIRKSHYKSVLRLKDRALKSLRENMGNDGWE